MDASQESRTERAGVAVTPYEKAALRFISIRRRTSESELLRTMLLADIVAEFDRIMKAADAVDSGKVEAA